jgi:hypothetical protein
MRALIVALIIVSTTASADPAKDRAAVAQRVYTGQVAALKVGRATVEMPYVWSVRLLDSDIAAGKPRKKALAEHLARMQDVEAYMAKAKDLGTVSVPDYEASTYFRIEAEMWIATKRR